MKLFEERLRIAFKYAKNAEIARILGISQPAVKNYFDGRVPSADVLVQIKNLTNVSIDWLLTGNGEMYNEVKTPSFSEMFEQKIREIVKEELAKEKREAIVPVQSTVRFKESNLSQPEVDKYSEIIPIQRKKAS